MVRAFLSQYVVYIAIAAVLAAGTAGWKVRDWQCVAASAKAAERAAEKTAKMQKAIDDQSAKFELERAALSAAAGVRSHTLREIFREVPAPSTACAPPPAVGGVLMDAVEDANRAASGPPGQSGNAVPAARPTPDATTGP